MAVKLYHDDGRVFDIGPDGTIVGANKRIEGAVAVNKQDQPTDSYFLDEVLEHPEKIRWKAKNGRQRVYLYDAAGRILGNYVLIVE